MPSPQQYTLQTPSPGLPGVMYQGSPGMSHTPGAVTEAQGTIMELEGKVTLPNRNCNLIIMISSCEKSSFEKVLIISVTVTLKNDFGDKIIMCILYLEL